MDVSAVYRVMNDFIYNIIIIINTIAVKLVLHKASSLCILRIGASPVKVVTFMWLSSCMQ
jgi:hypothetical protein